MLFAKPVGWPASSVTVMIIFFMPNTRTHSWSIQVTLKDLIAGTGYLNQNCPGKSGTQSYIFSTVVCVAQNYISTVVHTLCCFSLSLSLSIESYLKLHGLMPYCSHRAHKQYKYLSMRIWHVTCLNVAIPFIRLWTCCSLWQDHYRLLQRNCSHLELFPGQSGGGQAGKEKELVSKIECGLGE